jgi:hypothetical protein
MLTVKRAIKIMTNKYGLLFKKIDDDVITLTRNTCILHFTSINVKLKLKIDLFLFFFQNSTVYDLSNCCVTFAPHCNFIMNFVPYHHTVPGEMSFIVSGKTSTSNQFKIFKKFRNDCVSL